MYFFFVVSGFLITNIIANRPAGLFKPSVSIFYVQRIGRIWPLFYVWLLMGALIFLVSSKDNPIHLYYFPGETYGLWFWLSGPAFVFNWFLAFHPALAVGFPVVIAWSLSVEEQFYFFYPLLLKKLRSARKLIWFLTAFILSALGCRLALVFYGVSNGYFWVSTEFDLIAMGGLLYLAFKKSDKFLSRNSKLSLILCLAGLAILLVFYLGFQGKTNYLGAFMPDLLGLGLFAFLLGGLHLDFFEAKSLKILSLPGKYCYGGYLLHPTVLFFIKPYFTRMNFPAGFIFFVALTTLISAISFHLFEMPVNRLIRKTFGASR